MSAAELAPRIVTVNHHPVGRGDYVLYWMIAARRTARNFALDHALVRARELARPLVVFEALRAGYRWASDRLHSFVLDGMAANARAFADAGITYLPYVEPEPGAGSGMLVALAQRACLVITDEQPGFFLPRMIAAAGAALPIRLESVDGTGMMPLRASPRAFTTAASFRRHLQKTLPPYLLVLPQTDPLATSPRSVRGADLRGTVLRRWPPASAALLAREPAALAALPIDHAVSPCSYRGGLPAARLALDTFLEHRLPRYATDRNDPDAEVASGLSPYLHFGHLGVHEIVTRVLGAADWNPSRLSPRPTGSRAGWWGAPEAVEGFLDELITWRELGYGFCFHRGDYDRWASLPEWARTTLAQHASDPRPHLYTRAQLERAQTHDPIWNAAQRQLVAEGRIHNYLRMLWGKKVLEWSRTPRVALATLIELNNKYAVDGRDPNSYSGIFWIFGRFDRPWGPVRPIFGTVRYMSSDATRRKLDLKRYLARWS